MWASEKQREECPLSDLWISVKCGESDTTSGLASNPTAVSYTHLTLPTNREV